jgi:hypothetical protein
MAVSNVPPCARIRSSTWIVCLRVAAVVLPSVNVHGAHTAVPLFVMAAPVSLNR